MDGRPAGRTDRSEDFAAAQSVWPLTFREDQLTPHSVTEEEEQQEVEEVEEVFSICSISLLLHAFPRVERWKEIENETKWK